MKINKIKIKKYLEIFSDLSDILIHVKNIKSPLSVASLGLKLYSSFSKYNKKPDPFKKYNHLGFNPIGNYLFNKLSYDKNSTITHESDGHYSFLEYKEFGITRANSDKRCYFHFKEKIREADFYNIISDMLWENIKYGELKRPDDTLRYYELSNIDLSKYEYFESDKFNIIYNYSNNFIKNKEPLIFLMTGMEGSGKSSCCLHLFKKLNLNKILLLNEKELSNYNFKQDFNKMIETLKPEAIILDDFKLDTFEGYLSNLEYIRENIKIFAITSNLSVEDFKTNKLDRAKIRCGRIDKVFEFNDIDENVKLKFIPKELSQDTKERLLKLNIASIKEFHRRYNILNIKDDESKIKEELEEIEERFK